MSLLTYKPQLVASAQCSAGPRKPLTSFWEPSQANTWNDHQATRQKALRPSPGQTCNPTTTTTRPSTTNSLRRTTLTTHSNHDRTSFTSTAPQAIPTTTRLRPITHHPGDPSSEHQQTQPKVCSLSPSNGLASQPPKHGDNAPATPPIPTHTRCTFDVYRISVKPLFSRGWLFTLCLRIGLNH